MALSIIALQYIRRSVVKKYYERGTPLWVTDRTAACDAEMVLLCVAPVGPTRACRRGADPSPAEDKTYPQTCNTDWAIARSLVACSKH